MILLAPVSLLLNLLKSTSQLTMAAECCTTPCFRSTWAHMLKVAREEFCRHFQLLEQKVCGDHKICWCEECVKEYICNHFTDFNNKCFHWTDGQCQAHSTYSITQLELALTYIDKVEHADEEALIKSYPTEVFGPF